EGDDSFAIERCAELLRHYEHGRYALKRIGKGGSWSWTEHGDLRFAVELQPPVEQLVAVFDRRVSRMSNPLSGHGSWAPARFGWWFPTPVGYRYVHCEHGELVNRPPRPSSDEVWIFAPVPNLKAVRPRDEWHHAGTELAPPWLLQWLDLE